MKLQNDLREFIALLNLHDVRYVLVGGYAVAYHGFPRYTGDIDFFIDIASGNTGRLVTALYDFGFASDTLDAQLFTFENRIIQLGVPPNRIDLLTSISGVTFEETWANRIHTEIDGQIVPVISLELLRRNKQASARPKDLLDLDNL